LTSLVWPGNVEKLGAGVDKWLETQQANLGGMRDLTNFVNNEDALSGTLQKHGIGMFFDVAREFFKDAGASMLTVRAHRFGRNLGLIADFKAGSPLGKFVAAQAPGAADGDRCRSRVCPQGIFLVAGAGHWNSRLGRGGRG